MWAGLLVSSPHPLTSPRLGSDDRSLPSAERRLLRMPGRAQRFWCGCWWGGAKMSEGEDYESVLCVKPEVHVYRVPPRASNRGYRAAEWQLDQPSWSGRMRITAQGNVAFIKLEDKNSGELFAQASVDQFPSIAVESVTDSSRYFVIRVEDGNGRRAFIGIGFVDRGDAFDFNVALQDHFKWVKQQTELAKEAQNPTQGPKLDLGFKEGQTIKLNIANMKKKDGSSGSRPRSADFTGLPLLPPPPGGKTPFLPTPEEELPLPLPGTSADAVQTVCQADVAGSQPSQPPSSSREAFADIWGDFTKASGSGSQPQQNSDWVQF
ncbi:adaptin ear-binding coat-associated protein 2 isoform X2 [Pantherophis guttatus]|uniref:Adaptin ear-binding coat-associated protein 2 isoform X2 n=1 Tax=Pantherophis guttatus TaxID=94885 RepID=A0ABM3YWJ1_PANGU|nr:adaptin ear-binding coat-associated protein 2 isoform X2 [Pantherophis guttatus]